MTRQRRFLLATLLAVWAGVLLACGGGGKTTEPAQEPETKPAPKPSEVPPGVNYTIINEQTVPGIKRSLDVRLERKVSEAVLRSIALKLKDSDPNSYERTFIVYYLPGMEVNAGGWATARFDPHLEVRILGLTAEQDEGLEQPPATDPAREVIGSWLLDLPTLGRRITIFRQGGELYMEEEYKDGSSRKKEIIEKPSSKGRKFMDARRTGPDHDYYLTDRHGDLQIWSKDIDGSHVLVWTAKRIP